MKTINHIALLSLVLILLSANTGYAADVPGKKIAVTKVNNIKYEVTIILNCRIDLCDAYYIQVTDETGRLVSRPQLFDPAKRNYVFTEKGPAQGKIRVAMLVKDKRSDGIECHVQIGARPDVKMGPFLQGETYYFTLRTLVSAPNDKE